MIKQIIWYLHDWTFLVRKGFDCLGEALICFGLSVLMLLSAPIIPILFLLDRRKD